MPALFSQSLRLLESSRRGRVWWLLAAGGLLVAWGTWLAFAPLELKKVSDAARLETSAQTHRVAAPVAGQVVAVRAQLGDDVEAGAPLVELDSSLLRLELKRERVGYDGLRAELEVLRQQIAVAETQTKESRRSGRALTREAEAALREAEVAARSAGEEAGRSESLHRAGTVAEAEASVARARAEQRRAVADSMRTRIERLEAEAREALAAQRGQVQALGRELTRLEGLLDLSEATMSRLEREIERRVVVAPVTGQVGRLGEIRVGAVLDVGEFVAAIVPEGDLRVVAMYPAGDAVGRIARGQSARVRLDGFPWTRFGTLTARVAKVAGEAREGRIRVELDISNARDFAVPLRHGMTGSVEVAVETTTPLDLILRAAGRAFSGGDGGPVATAP